MVERIEPKEYATTTSEATPNPVPNDLANTGMTGVAIP
jgi:hypothetical protein